MQPAAPTGLPVHTCTINIRKPTKTETHRQISHIQPLLPIIIHHCRRQPVVRDARLDARGQAPDQSEWEGGGGELVPARDLEASVGERAGLVKGQHLVIVVVGLVVCC